MSDQVGLESDLATHRGSLRSCHFVRCRLAGILALLVAIFGCLPLNLQAAQDNTDQLSENLNSVALRQSGSPQERKRPLAGWVAASPRDEIRPEFDKLPGGGPEGQGLLAITADDREGLVGSWVHSMPIVGGQAYRFL